MSQNQIEVENVALEEAKERANRAHALMTTETGVNQTAIQFYKAEAARLKDELELKQAKALSYRLLLKEILTYFDASLKTEFGDGPYEYRLASSDVFERARAALEGKE